jgi:hypothetical protein
VFLLNYFMVSVMANNQPISLAPVASTAASGPDARTFAVPPLRKFTAAEGKRAQTLYDEEKSYNGDTLVGCSRRRREKEKGLIKE